MKAKIVRGVLALFSFFSAIALVIVFPSSSGLSLDILKNTLDGTMVNSTILFLAIFYLSNKTKKLWHHLIPTAMMSAFIALLWLFARSVHVTGTFNAVFSEPSQIAQSLIYWAGMTYLLFIMGEILYILCSGKMLTYENRSEALGFSEKNVFIRNMILIFLAWLPYLITDFPGHIAWDTWREINMFLGIDKFTTHHPLAHVMLVKTVVKLGWLMGNGSIGILLLTISQMMMFAAVIAYEIEIMRDMHVPAWIRRSTLVIAMFSVFYSYFSVEIIKDCQYSHFFLLMILEGVQLLRKGKAYFASGRHMALMSIAVCGVLLFRKNGKYIVYLMLFVCLIWLIEQIIRKGFSFVKSLGIRPFIVVLCPILIAGLFETIIIMRYDIVKATSKDILSFPLQLTARYCKEHPDEVTKEEAEAIDAIVNYGRLKDLYNPIFADPVKNTYRYRASMRDWTRYLRVWAEQGIKHPVTYIKAAIHHTYPLYYPFAESKKSSYGKRNEPLFKEAAERIDYMVRTPLENSQVLSGKAVELMYSIPIIGIFSSMAVYTLILVYLAMYAAIDRMKEYLILIFPLILSIMVVFISPIIGNSERYAFPFIYSTPIAVAYFYNAYKNRKLQG